MPLDGISTRFLCRELNRFLTGSRVDKITQPGRFDIVLQLRQPGQTHRLLLSANPSNPRIHTVEQTGAGTTHPPMFCMLLRKHLQGARLTGVHRVSYERIIRLAFQTINEMGDPEEKYLICELMGRHSNLILVNSGSRIIDAVTHVDARMSRVREIMPARPYTNPPDQAKWAPDAVLAAVVRAEWRRCTAELAAAAGTNRRKAGLAALLLQQIAGLSPQFCQSVCCSAALDPQTLWSELRDEDICRLERSLIHWLALATGETAVPTLFYRDSRAKSAIDFHALPLDGPACRRNADSLTEAMRIYYNSRETDNRLEQQRRSALQMAVRHQQRLSRLMDVYQSDLAASGGYEQLKIKGDLIFAHLWQISEGMETVTVDNDYADPPEPATIELNPSRSPAWNAQRYYKQYNKNKAKYENAARFAEKAGRELAYLDALITMLQNADDAADIRSLSDELAQAFGGAGDAQKAAGTERGFYARKAARTRGGGAHTSERPLGPRTYQSSDGLTILVGRNNRQNDQLTLRTAQKTDLWLHVQKAPGTHVVVRAEGRPIPERTIEEAARIAAWFSRGERRREQGGSGAAVPVDYCPAGHVRKPAGARPGMVIYDQYKTALVKPIDPADLLPSAPPRSESESEN